LTARDPHASELAGLRLTASSSEDADCADWFSLANRSLTPIRDRLDSVIMAAVLEGKHTHDLERVPRSSPGLYQAHPLPDFELV
jgi:hypothetical protein